MTVTAEIHQFVLHDMHDQPALRVRREDPDAPFKGRLAVLKTGAQGPNGVLMGLFDKDHHKATKQVIAWSRFKIPDEKYHWYMIRRTGAEAALQGKNEAQVYLENWKIGAKLPISYKGKYDCWLLVKAQGPRYVEGSTKENMIFLSRVLLVPVK